MAACRWIKDADVPGGKYLVPGCMGSAVYGLRGCTCSRRRARDDLERRVEKLESRLAAIEGAFMKGPSE